MKNTAFTHIHEKLGAKLVPFAGYQMPVEYTGINDEHVTVREKLGVFDVSHMGEFWAKGPKAFEFVQKITTNDVAALSDGKVQYSCFPNGKGGIVDDLLVYRIDAETYLLVVNAANIDKDYIKSRPPMCLDLPQQALYEAYETKKDHFLRAEYKYYLDQAKKKEAQHKDNNYFINEILENYDDFCFNDKLNAELIRAKLNLSQLRAREIRFTILKEKEGKK